MWNFSFRGKRLDEDLLEEENVSNGANRETEERKTMSDAMNFDMQQIGRNIAACRKAKNMTQMNLADQMNISFQAVSNWERGQTMPDISKLPELASILDCSIDELLGNGRTADVVRHIVAEEPLEEAISLEELSAVAPALEPRRTEEIFAERVKEDQTWNFAALEELAPFLDQATLGQTVLEALDKGVEIEDISGLAPFLGRSQLGEITRRLLDLGHDFSDLDSLAPFMDRSDLALLVQKHLAKGGGIEDITSLAPFLNRSDLGDALDSYLAGGGEIEDITSLTPFLDRDRLGRLALAAVKQGKDIGSLTAMAPFLNRSDLAAVVKHYLEAGGRPDNVMGLAPFLDRDSLQTILSYTLNQKKKGESEPLN